MTRLLGACLLKVLYLVRSKLDSSTPVYLTSPNCLDPVHAVCEGLGQFLQAAPFLIPVSVSCPFARVMPPRVRSHHPELHVRVGPVLYPQV